MTQAPSWQQGVLLLNQLYLRGGTCEQEHERKRNTQKSVLSGHECCAHCQRVALMLVCNATNGLRHCVLMLVCTAANGLRHHVYWSCAQQAVCLLRLLFTEEQNTFHYSVTWFYSGVYSIPTVPVFCYNVMRSCCCCCRILMHVSSITINSPIKPLKPYI